MFPTELYLQKAAQHMVPCYGQPDFIAERGEGVYLWDLKDNKYLDFAGGIGVNALGHAHPEVAEAIATQARKLLHTSNALRHPGYIDVCSRLAEISFGVRVFLTNSGGEAVECAIKAARRYFHKKGDDRSHMVATLGAFHGRTLGGLALTGQPLYREGYEKLLCSTNHVPYGDIEAMRATVTEQTMMVMMEPIQGNGGIRVAPAGYLAALREHCDSTGTLLCFDEVQTGFGRTGKWFAHEHDGVIPDIMTIAKALGAGLPLGAMIAGEEVGTSLDVGSHGTTFGGNPVACAAALKSMEIIERDGLIQRAAKAGAALRERLEILVRDDPSVIGLRGRGLMLGVKLDNGIVAKEVRSRCVQAGLLVTHCGADIIRLLPPLIAQDEHFDECVDKLSDALRI